MNVSNKSEKMLLVAHISDQCNFQCAYCYSHRSKKSMSDKVIGALAEFANSLINNKFCRSIVLAVEGGEPMLNISRLEKLVKSAQGKNVNEFIVCTNGSNLNKKTVDFLASNRMYPVISFEAKESFIRNRVSRNPKVAEGAWHKINNSLALFRSYLSYYNQDELDDFDVIRGRVTITPSTIKYLADSVGHLYKSAVGDVILITLMPAMSEDLDKKWRVLASNKKAIAILENEFKKIAKLYLWGLRNRKHLNFCINECISLDFTGLASRDGLKQIPFCGAGNNLIGIDMKGGIFPCYLLSARPSSSREEFKIGDVFSGFNKDRGKIIDKFCGKKENKHFSCFYWNRIANGSPDKPAAAYTLLFNAWKKAAYYVQKELKKK